jgi:hypothetical protein
MKKLFSYFGIAIIFLINNEANTAQNFSIDEQLMIAIDRQDVAEVRRLFIKGANANYRMEIPSASSPFQSVTLTPLLAACSSRSDKKLIAVLLENGADIEYKVTFRKNSEQLSIIELLERQLIIMGSIKSICISHLEKKEKKFRKILDYRNSALLYPQLIEAIYNDNLEIIQNLIADGIDVNYCPAAVEAGRLNFSNIPLGIAIYLTVLFLRDTKIIEELLNAGAEIEIFNGSINLLALLIDPTIEYLNDIILFLREYKNSKDYSTSKLFGKK